MTDYIDVMSPERLISLYFSTYDDDTILKAVNIYPNDLLLSDNSCLKAELHVWRFPVEK